MAKTRPPSSARSAATRPPLAGPVPRVPGVEHAGRGAEGPSAAAAGRAPAAAAAPEPAPAAARRSGCARSGRGRPLVVGARRVRLRPGRRDRPRLGGADRRRAGHRQVHDPAPGGGRLEARATHPLRLRRGVGAAGAAARRPARRGDGGGHPSCPRPSWRHPGARRRVSAPTCSWSTPSRPSTPGPRRRARQRGPGARVRGRLQRYAKETGTCGLPGGARDQGRRDRRPQDAGAHRGHGALLRGGGPASTTGCCARPRTASEPWTRSASSA
jgi:hypothetical protein